MPRTSKKGFEVMVIVDTPRDFPSWPLSQRLERYERVMQWHDDYVPDLHKQKVLTHAWGSHQLLSRFDATTSQGPLVTVLKVRSWKQFDAIIDADPLRDVSTYVTSPLDTLLDDQRTDIERTEYAREQLHRGKSIRQLSLLEDSRAEFNGPPEFVGKYKLKNPKNAPTDLRAREKQSDHLNVLVIGMNPDHLIQSWTDARAFVLYEKVNWWFDYMAMMVERGYVTHAWGTHDFCNVSGMSTNSKGAAAVYRVRDMEEFHIVYNLDPLREWAKFHTVLLRPIADQRIADKARLDQAKRRLREN